MSAAVSVSLPPTERWQPLQSRSLVTDVYVGPELLGSGGNADELDTWGVSVPLYESFTTSTLAVPLPALGNGPAAASASISGGSND